MFINRARGRREVEYKTHTARCRGPGHGIQVFHPTRTFTFTLIQTRWGGLLHLRGFVVIGSLYLPSSLEEEKKKSTHLDKKKEEKQNKTKKKEQHFPSFSRSLDQLGSCVGRITQRRRALDLVKRTKPY